MMGGGPLSGGESGHDIDHPPLYSAEFKDGQNCTSTPLSVSPVTCYVMIFTFTCVVRNLEF